MRIAVDAMGGDRAPAVVVQGALQAAIRWGLDVILVGDRKAVADELGHDANGVPVSVHHCEERVLMHEAPLKALRRKKRASIKVAFELLKSGQADAVVSAGNSGATLAAAILTLGRLKGIERPALVGILPGEKGPVLLTDVGANVDSRPEHLFQFGVMADAFAASCLGMEAPKIGLLSIGEENGKGSGQVRMAFELFQASALNFVGNVEGRDILTGEVQIVVCDGFVGNVALKLGEGIVDASTRMLKRELMSSMTGRAGLWFGRRSFEKLKKKLDYAEYGGAPILGIQGLGIVCHGGSSPKAITNAVGTAARYAEEDIPGRLAACMKDCQARIDGLRVSEQRP